MDYEKAYKEALERARELSIDGYLDAIAIDELFPELAESEDEEIKEYLISFIKMESGVNLPPDDAEKILAWIKKQWQKPAERSEEDEKLTNRIEGWLETLCDYLKDSSPECIEDVKDIVEQLKSLKQKHTWKPSEKQIEALEDEVRNNKTVFRKKVLKELLEQLKKL